jgi:hypothetical protein
LTIVHYSEVDRGTLHAIYRQALRLSALLAAAPALAGKTILEKSGAIERAIAVAASFGEQAA